MTSRLKFLAEASLKRSRKIVSLPFNPGFREANGVRTRYRVLLGSAGSGKSVNVARDYIAKLSDPKNRGANLLVIRKVEASHRDSTFAELVAAIRATFGGDYQSFWDVSQVPPRLTCRVTGSRILFRGVNGEEAREKLKSVSVDEGKIVWVWIEEATELSEHDFDVIDDRLRGDLSALNPELYYQITLTFNPVSASHWIKRRFFDVSDPDVYTHRSTYLDNRFIDEAYHRRMERRKREDPDGYRVYGLGEWGGGEGKILTHYRVAPCERDYGAYDRVTLGQDFGYHHADCILTLGFRDGNIFVLSELYETARDTAELIALARAQGIPDRFDMYCDSAEPDRIRMWKRAGYRAVPVVKEPGSVSAQIDYLKQHALTVDPSCVNLLRELDGWEWELDPATGAYLDSPACSPDDAIAALRYGIEPLRRMPKLRLMSKERLGL